MQRELKRALDQTTDTDLAHMLVAARQGELEMGAWASQLAACRDVKRRLDDADDWQPLPVPSPTKGWFASLRGIPFLWEALAFALGCMTSFLVI